MSNGITNVDRRGYLRLAGIAGAVAAGVPILGACSIGSSKTSSSKTGGGTPKRGGRLTVGVGGGQTTETLNPNYATTSVELARASQLFDTLMTYTPEFKVTNSLAESLEPNKDATLWTLRLRAGVEFHNGKTLAASDVKYTLLNWILSKKNPGAGASHFNTLDVAGVKVVDARTLQLPFKQPYSALSEALAVLASNCVRIVPEGFDLKSPVGTGPYKFKSFKPGQQSVFVRNDNYWKTGEPYFDEIVIVDINDDTARINALVSGQVDAISNVPSTNLATLKNSPGITVLNSKTGSFNPLTMRTDIAPFNDVRVRQAFRLIADRKQMVNNALDGQAQVANDLYSPFDPAYNHDIPQRSQDIAKAKSLLRAAGHSGLTIPLVTSNIAAGEVEACQVFAQQAKAAGVTVKVQQVQPTQFWAQNFLKSAFSVSNWATRSYLIQASDSMLKNSAYNEQHWSDPEWDKLISQALATTEKKNQAELIQQAQQIEWDRGGYIVWGFFNTVDAYKSDLHGFVEDRSGLDLSSWGFSKVWRQ